MFGLLNFPANFPRLFHGAIFVRSANGHDVPGLISGLEWLPFVLAALFGLLAAAAKIFRLIVFGVDEEKFRVVAAAVEQ